MDINLARAIGSIGVCAAGAASMYFTKGESGMGWAVLGLLLIWNSA